jgi:hypothetical protein
MPTLERTAAAVPHNAKKFKVMLTMGDGQPHFEVRDGEEVVLKVHSVSVNVRTTTDRGEYVSALNASQRVKFTTPGGEGSCEELEVQAGTGEIIASRNVTFKYTWGKFETALNSERMTFRLGSAGPAFQREERSDSKPLEPLPAPLGSAGPSPIR